MRGEMMGRVGFGPGVFESLPEGKFSLGLIALTKGMAAMVAEGDDGGKKLGRAKELLSCLGRHVSGDWGDVCAEDKAENNLAVDECLRIFSAYCLSDGTKIWVITEADRSTTTILLPSEY